MPVSPPPIPERQTSTTSKGSLLELAILFLRLGATAMGGPAVHIAMMEEEIVARRRWLTREEFLDFLGATNLIPGPNSTEMAIHVGRIRAGWAGLLVAGISFILPAALMVSALAWTYVRYGALPQIAALLYGVKPVVIVIIAQGAYRLGKSAVKSTWLGVLGTLALAAAAIGVDPLVTLFGAGAVAGLVHLRRAARETQGTLGAWMAFGTAATTGVTAHLSLGLLFLVMLKIGATLFGGGYVLVAFLRADLVARLHWLTERQLLDAVAAGQVTPGPLFTTATFIGYVIGGVRGAVAATMGIFLPAFVLVAISGPLVPKLRRSSVVAAALDGINVAALALMIVVSAQLARTAVVDWLTLAIAGVSAVLLFRYRLNSTWLVLGGAAVGAGALWAHMLLP
jgi:chromate transporter